MFVFDLWLTLPLVLCALPQTAFVLLYGVPRLGAGEWWGDYVGRALFFKSATLAVLLDVLAARLAYLAVDAQDVTVKAMPPAAAIDGVFSVLYWLIFASICYQLAALVHERATH